MLLIWTRPKLLSDKALESIRHNSADSIPTSYLVCIKMASILNSQITWARAYKA